MDWITTYLEYTDGTPSPELFRKWAGISAIAGSLERRVWSSTARSALYPNLFVLLVSSPGIGKSIAIDPVAGLWHGTGKLFVSPKNMSRAGLIDTLRDSSRKVMLNGELLEYTSLQLAVGELGVFIPAHDLDFLSTLNDLYDNPKYYRERKRGIGKEIKVDFPQLNMLAGSQPGYLAELLPEPAWTMGFTSRLIMVYAANGPVVSFFDAQEPRQELEETLALSLKENLNLNGAFVWSPEAKEGLESWHKSGAKPVPTHSKLQHYTPRRALHVIKLSMIAAVSRSGEMLVEHEDFSRARDWLLEAEGLMPDIFREMLQKSDKQIIEELHFYLWQWQVKNKGNGMKSTGMYNFLQNRVPAEKVQRIIELAEKSGIIARQAGSDDWIARPKHDHGLE